MILKTKKDHLHRWSLWEAIELVIGQELGVGDW